MKTLAVSCLETVSPDEAKAYIEAAHGDELEAAVLLAMDRNELDGSQAAPDETEVHHAYFLLRRAQGLEAPSFDSMRIQLKKKIGEAA